MTTVVRYAVALSAAALLLPSGTLRAGGELLGTPEGYVVPSQERPAPVDCDAGSINVCVLKSQPRWEVNAALLFLQPSSGNLVYATLINPFPFLTPNWSDQVVRPGFTPAFNVGTRYVFGSGCDVQLSWTHLSTYDHASAGANTTPVVVPGVGTFTQQALGPQFLSGPPPPFTSANALAHFAYDAVNLDGGLLLGAGNHAQLRLFAGLQSAVIRQSLTTTFQSPDASIAFVDASQASFSGVGPRLGMDLHYLAGGLDLLGGIGGAALVGTRQSRINFFTVSPADTAAGLVPNTQFLTTPSTTQLIPGIDARLAASYAIPLGNCRTLNLAAGYQAAAYFGVINQYTLTEVENPAVAATEGSAAVFLRSSVESQSNFLVHGPFLRLGLQF